MNAMKDGSRILSRLRKALLTAGIPCWCVPNEPTRFTTEFWPPRMTKRSSVRRARSFAPQTLPKQYRP